LVVLPLITATACAQVVFPVAGCPFTSAGAHTAPLLTRGRRQAGSRWLVGTPGVVVVAPITAVKNPVMVELTVTRTR